MWLLSKNPEAQARLRAEVTPVFADGARPGYRELQDLQWLDCVVCAVHPFFLPVSLF